MAAELLGYAVAERTNSGTSINQDDLITTLSEARHLAQRLNQEADTWGVPAEWIVVTVTATT